MTKRTPEERRKNIHGQPVEPCNDASCPHDFCYFDEFPETDCVLTDPHDDCVIEEELPHV